LGLDIYAIELALPSISLYLTAKRFLVAFSLPCSLLGDRHTLDCGGQLMNSRSKV
jgi:hypothetical protein